MEFVFKIVYNILVWFSSLTGLTYKEINIVAYYIILPSIYFYLIDRLIKKNYFKIGFLILIVISAILMESFKMFSKQLFQLSVDFLKWFDILGWNYVQASVIICVFVPILIYFILFFIVSWKKRIKITNTTISK